MDSKEFIEWMDKRYYECMDAAYKLLFRDVFEDYRDKMIYPEEDHEQQHTDQRRKGDAETG